MSTDDDLRRRLDEEQWRVTQQCGTERPFTGTDVERAIAGHVLAEARLTGTYSLNPSVR